MHYQLKDGHEYDDIIDLPHHVSKTHSPMSNYDRAAQFSPFSALTGYDEVIRETARVTEDKTELDEYLKAELDTKLRMIQEHLPEQPEITVTYFLSDEKKAGGAYVTVQGVVKKIDVAEKLVVMQDETRIPVEDIVKITEKE